MLILESYCTKAQLSDGMDVLDLGCGELFILLVCAYIHGLPLNRMGKLIIVSGAGTTSVSGSVLPLMVECRNFQTRGLSVSRTHRRKESISWLAPRSVVTTT